jgi:DUF2934 family protein
MMDSSPPKKPALTATSETEDLESQIRQRAHELYQERGQEDDHDLEDWLRAEEEITEKKVRTIAA